MATKELKTAFVQFMLDYFSELDDVDNKHIRAFKQRKVAEQLAVAPGRLVDQHAEMLAKWREYAGNSNQKPTAKLPIFLMGFDKGYSSTGLERGRSIADDGYLVENDNGDFFHLRLSKVDQRVQIVLYCPDAETAFLFADQFKLFCAKYENRHRHAYFKYADKIYPVPITLEDNNVFGANSQIPDQNNLTVFIFDLNFICNIPYFSGDKARDNPYLPTVKAVDIRYKENQLFYHRDIIKAFEKVKPIE